MCWLQKQFHVEAWITFAFQTAHESIARSAGIIVSQPFQGQCSYRSFISDLPDRTCPRKTILLIKVKPRMVLFLFIYSKFTISWGEGVLSHISCVSWAQTSSILIYLHVRPSQFVMMTIRAPPIGSGRILHGIRHTMYIK